MKQKIYPLLENPYRSKDLNLAMKVLRSKKLTMGEYTKKFEKLFSKKIKLKNSLMVNSGSSANFLAFQCLINPYRKRRLKIGDQVLIPALCWSTSLWPIIQSGLKPVFVDIDPKTLNIDLNDLEKKISKYTKALMLVHVLGNCTDMNKLCSMLKKRKIILIEDTCESLGSKFNNKFLGTYGEMSSFSFYSSHQISSGEGGMISCKSSMDYEIIKSLRSHGWSRGLKNEKKIANNFKHLDNRFIFYNSGYNLRPTDITASIGLSQFKDLEKFKKIRNYNRNLIVTEMLKNNDIKNELIFIQKNKNVDPSWFGIPIILKNKNKKKKFIKKIESSGIETRPIISGNFLKQPAIKKYKLTTKNKFINADYINERGFFIGLPTRKLNKYFVKRIVGIFEKNL